MDPLNLHYVILVILTCVLASISIWSPRKLWVKGAAVAVTVAIFVVGYMSLASLLSLPKPVDLAWTERNVPEAQVLAASLREDVAIYIWLEMDGYGEPRAYALGWNMQLAEQLQEAMYEAEANGTGVRANFPFETGTETTEPTFYADPQPALPPKQANQDNPLVYEQPDNGG